MSTNSSAPSQVAEDHLLEFYEERRRCFLNTRTRLRHIWSAFELADTVWVRELDDLKVLSDRKKIISLGLFHDALVKIRLSTELAFSRCPTEACHLMRSAVESVAYGTFLTAEPRAALVWASKNLGEDPRRAYMRHFVWGTTREEKKEKKREGGSAIFAKGHGLGKLRPFWKRYSEFGAHTTFGGMVTRLSNQAEKGEAHFEFRYLDTSRDVVVSVLCDLLVCCRTLEGFLYSAFAQRLHLDHELERLRDRMAKEVSKVVEWLRREYRKLLENRPGT